jgi:hypothetical protein
MMRGVALLLVLCWTVVAWAQQSNDKPMIRVGIASPENMSRSLFNAPNERDQMVRDINNQSGTDKKAPARIEAVALEGSTMDEVADQLRQKDCQYVALTTASEQIGVAGYDSAGGIPDPMKPVPDNSPSAARVLGVKYSISRVGDPAILSHGAILAEGRDDGFGQSAIQSAFRDTALRIRNEVKRMTPRPIH